MYDGSGKPPFRADVAVKARKIALVGETDVESATTIDASGMAVAPGAIDAHSHSDLTLPTHNRAESSIRQGITTEVAGSCGWSMAPCKKETIEGVLKWLIGALASPDDYANAGFGWRTFGEFLDALEKKGIGTNLYPVVGQSLIRAHVVGTEDRPASRGEIEAMKALLKEAIQEGAQGISTGRSYEPGGFANTDEIVELARVVAAYGGVYTSHIRSEGNAIFAAVEEAIEVGRRSGVSVQISHHKDIGKANFGKVNRTLEMMEEARAEGIRVHCDVYPYDFAQVSPMWRMLPRSVQRLGAEQIMAKLADESFRADIRKEFSKKNKTGQSMLEMADDYIVVDCAQKPEIEWKSFAEIGGAKDLVDAMADLLIETKMQVKAAARMNEDDVRTVIRHPMTMIGTDAFAFDRHMGEEVAVHPRHYGSFPRVLGHYVRDVRLVSLEEMVRKVTQLPARKFGIRERGEIKEGFFADMLVFDPSVFTDKATAKEPYLTAPGLKQVIVNGKITLDNDVYRPVFAGTILRRA